MAGGCALFLSATLSGSFLRDDGSPGRGVTMNRYRNVVILVAMLVVAGLVWIAFRGKGKPGDGNNGTVTTNQPVLVTQPHPPPALNNPVRIREVYEEGKTYRRTAVFGIEAVGQHQRWGLGVDYTLLFAGRVVTETSIEKNDGVNIIARVAVTEAKYENARKQFEGVRVDLGQRAHILLEVLSKIAEKKYHVKIPPGTSVLAENTVNRMLDTPKAREIVRMWPFKTFHVQPVEGYTFRICFTDGKGVTNIEMLKAPENRDFGGQAPFIDEVAMLDYARSYNPVWDRALFPKEDVAIGEEWQISGQSLPNLFPPSLFVQITDAITMRREPDESGLTFVTVPEHSALAFTSRPQGRRVHARLSLSGKLHYDPSVQLFKTLRFNGKLPIEDLSTDYWVFPSRHSMVPNFDVQYTCEVLD